MADRPYRLECWEGDPDTGVTEWRLWTTYVTSVKAEERKQKLISKGHTARVVYLDAEVCGLCDEQHEPPYDGSCLL